MNTQSLWEATSKRTSDYPTLNQDINVDVAIVGGGITGVTAALQLINAGKKVAIIEAHQVGGVTTSYSTGNLYIAVQPYYQTIVDKFNLEVATVIAHARNFAIDFIEKNIHEKKIDCHFSRRPWYAYSNDENRIPILEKEFEIFKKMNVSVNYTDTLPLDFKFKKAIVIENQARFNPLQYVITLTDFLKKKDCLIFENTRVVDISETKQCILKTATGHKVTAKNVIIATHTPIGINPTQLFTAPYRSYVVAVRLKNNVYPEGHFWDLDFPHHATCTHGFKTIYPELLMVAGSHHKTGQDGNMKKHYEELKKFLKQQFPVDEIAFEWSAQHYQTADTVPYIGLAHRFAKNTYMATGFFADGLIYGTLGALLLADIILGKENPWSKIFDSNRFTPKASASFFIKENTNYIAQYYKDFPGPSTTQFDDLKAGEARVVNIENEKWGVYRDEQAKLHIVSAVCTHMKCLVNWNNAEKTWDCPCHGSRFCHEGKVIEGPALKDLKKMEL